jgi:HEAT repeat protein
MVTALTSPHLQVRLQALDAWEELLQQERTGSVDPLLLALNDPDKRVHDRAQALIEQYLRREQAAPSPQGP